MKMYSALLCACISLICLSCQSSSRVDNSEEGKVVGVKTDNVSDLIRMPISASSELDTTLAARFDFEETILPFDTIFEGDIVEHAFKFKNIGKTSLIINDVKSSCGCTVPYFSKEAVAPGESGVIKVKFDSKGKLDKQTKSVTIYANTYPNKTVLRMFGFVKSK